MTFYISQAGLCWRSLHWGRWNARTKCRLLTGKPPTASRSQSI